MFKDTTLTATSKKRELIIFLICFVAAFILNVIGVLTYNSPGKELFTQIHVVILITLVFYGIVILFRVLYYLISRLWIRK